MTVFFFRLSSNEFLYLAYRPSILLLVAHELLLEGVLPLFFVRIITLLLHGSSSGHQRGSMKAKLRFAVGCLRSAAPAHHLPRLRGVVLWLLYMILL